MRAPLDSRLPNVNLQVFLTNDIPTTLFIIAKGI